MKSKRHTQILELISQRDIDTQEELLKALRECGFSVTQATVSRDIKDLRLVKVLADNGKYKYATGRENTNDVSPKFLSLFHDSVVNMDSAMNIIVIKTMNGMAQAVCAALDSLHWRACLGTLAGEDTIFVVCKNESATQEMRAELEQLLHAPKGS